ncbi:hypothetical protein GCK72_022693 [Caenorhabditis remanei]|nr:hypothetical protein GCK72_022693 [Caenorhabditis remanei]KAF1746240.1 hypothetical protein GCK72_022693 [Caenorhabditis remanei]
MNDKKERKEKCSGMPEAAAMLLVDLFIRDEKRWYQRVLGGCKKGVNERQKLLSEWQEELEGIGCDRTTHQIYSRIKGDLTMVKSRLSAEKVERGKTGGGLAKKSAKLDVARQKLYDHVAGSHALDGFEGGRESSEEPGLEMFSTVDEKTSHGNNGDEEDMDYNEIDDKMVLKRSDTKEKEDEVQVEEMAFKSTSFREVVQATPRKRGKQANDFDLKRRTVFDSQLELQEEKIDYIRTKKRILLDKEQRDLKLWEVQYQTAQLQRTLALEEVSIRGLIVREEDIIVREVDFNGKDFEAAGNDE